MITVCLFVLLLLISGAFKGYNDARGHPLGWKHLRDWIPGLLIGAALGGFGTSVAKYFGRTNSGDITTNGWTLLIIAAVILQLGSAIIADKIFSKRINPI